MKLYHQDLKGCFISQVGSNGLPEGYVNQFRSNLKQIQTTLLKQFDDGSLPLLHLPYLRKDLEDMKPHVERLQDDFSDIVILGTGGSSLGAQTICALAKHKTPHLHFLDNIDPYTFHQALDGLNPHTTAFLVVSKSGATAETLLQFLLCVEKWKTLTSDHSLKDHFVIITENKKSPLAKLADHWGMPRLDHDPHMGGRFSCLSIVGLLPAALLELDTISIRQGAAHTLEQTLRAEAIEEAFPVQGAAFNYGFAKEKSMNMAIIMPYIDRLQHFALWYRQLWAESLGKEGMGTTPVNALGAVDQHSQLQLYLDGPRDKFFTVITQTMAGHGDKLSFLPIEDPEVALYQNKSLGDLMEAEQQATIQTLIRNQCPTRVMHLSAVTEANLGALLMHFMLETIFTAGLMHINPFNQPAVEEGKKIARQLLQAL
jgi:glucose-6-phosphate isomerase